MGLMTKLQFLLALNNKLSGLPQNEVEERLNFYSEMIEDRMEEGMPEEEAVAAVGSVDEIVTQITAEIPLVKIVKEKIKSTRRMKAWEVTLLAVGSPVWMSLLIAAVAVVVSLYVSLWAVVISLWAVFASFVVGVVGALALGIGYSASGNLPAGLALIGAGCVCAGLAIFVFHGCKIATKGTLWLAKKMVFSVKNRFARRGEA
jgi:uncharacterized membrane protein